MRYTVSSGGVVIGETDLGFVRSEVAVRAGWFHPNAEGERLLPRLLPPLAMRAHLDRDAWAGDLAASAHHAEAYPLALHREDGAVVPTRTMGIQDMHELLAVAELEEARREALPWTPDREADGDDEPFAIDPDDPEADDHDPSGLLAGDASCDGDPADVAPADFAVEWAPDDEPTDFPRYQIILQLVDDAAIP